MATEREAFDERFAWLRRHADGNRDIDMLDCIYADRAVVLRHGTPPPDEWLSPLSIAGLRVRLPRRSAPASLDSLVEHLRDRVHARVPGFSAQDAGVVLDIGANEGIYAACRFAENPEVRVISVEPVPRTFRVLTETLLSNRKPRSGNHSSRCVAVRALAGAPVFASRSPGDFLEWSPQVSTIASRTLSSHGPRWAKLLATGTLRCPVISVDLLCGVRGIDHIDLLKVDVEGDELQVLAGSRHMLPRTARVVVEFHGRRMASSCRQLLEAYGFRIVHTDRGPVGDLYAERATLQHVDQQIADCRADKKVRESCQYQL